MALIRIVSRCLRGSVSLEGRDFFETAEGMARVIDHALVEDEDDPEGFCGVVAVKNFGAHLMHETLLAYPFSRTVKVLRGDSETFLVDKAIPTLVLVQGGANLARVLKTRRRWNILVHYGSLSADAPLDDCVRAFVFAWESSQNCPAVIFRFRWVNFDDPSLGLELRFAWMMAALFSGRDQT